VIIGQAPGIKAHESQIPWNDQSGDRLRHWLQVSRVDFYDKSKFSILPMGFCYPGKGRSGDLPPRPECAPKWHTQLLNASNNKVCILIGKYAQDYYLRDKRTLTERLKHWRGYLPEFVVMPHPSPRNNIWLKKNKWFESEVLPKQQSIISPLIKET
jgi:uracil-DNA glycosylase